MNGLSFTLLLLACGLYGAVHSLLASHTAKRLAERWFGPSVHRWYRLFFSLQGGLLLIPLLLLAWLLPDRLLYIIPMPWRVLSLLGQAAGGVMVLAAVQQTGAGEFLGWSQALGTSQADAARPPRLVTAGLYRWVRHPIYTGSLLFIWLMPVMSGNLLALNLGFSAYLFIGAWFEERKLRAEFGPAYSEYARRTPMIIPFLKFK